MRGLRIYLLILSIALCASLFFVSLRKALRRDRLKKSHIDAFDIKADMTIPQTVLQTPVADLHTTPDFQEEYPALGSFGALQSDTIMK
jgi:hypothetical protein